MTTQDRLITVREATELFPISASQFRTWQGTGLITLLQWTMINGKRAGLYSLSQVAAAVAERGDTRCPEGYVPLQHAAARMGVGRRTVEKWCERRKIRFVSGRVKGNPVRWICEADILAHQSTKPKSAATSTLVGQCHGEDVYEASTAVPVLYGILTRDDVAVLERRLARMRERGAMVA